MGEFEDRLRGETSTVATGEKRVKPSIVFEGTDAYDEVDEQEDRKYYSRSYHCLNCGDESEVYIQDGVPCPKNVRCPVCLCEGQNPVPLFVE